MLRRSIDAARGTALALLLLAGCGRDGGGSAAEQTSRYMLPQASGVHLGMSWGELQRTRPASATAKGC